MLHTDTKDILRLWAKNHEQQQQQHSQWNSLELAFVLFNRLEDRLNTALRDNDALKGENRALKQQIDVLETKLNGNKQTMRHMRAQLAAETEKADLLRIELREHQLACQPDEVQNVTIRHSRICDTVDRDGGSTKGLTKSRARFCPGTQQQMTGPTEKRAKRGPTKDENDAHDHSGPHYPPPSAARRRLLIPPPLVLTPLTTRFTCSPRRSVSAEPRATTHVHESIAMETATVVKNNELHFISSASSASIAAASTSAFSSAGNCSSSASGFSADSAMLGPVTWIRRNNEGTWDRTQCQLKDSWMAKCIRRGPLFSKPY